MAKFNWSNTAVITNITALISDVATSLTVSDATGYPDTDFKIWIDNEVIFVGSRTGATFSSLSRGHDGSAAAQHELGAAVRHSVTAEDFATRFIGFPIPEPLVGQDGYLLQYDHTNTEFDWVATSAVGVTDHGALGGLADDDHTLYHTDGRALAWLGTRSTTDLSEGTNLYYTNTRADARAALQDHDHDTPIATHAAIASAHHVKYTDAEAAAKIAADDLYVKIAGDAMAGNLVLGSETLVWGDAATTAATSNSYWMHMAGANSDLYFTSRAIGEVTATVDAFYVSGTSGRITFPSASVGDLGGVDGNAISLQSDISIGNANIQYGAGGWAIWGDSAGPAATSQSYWAHISGGDFYFTGRLYGEGMYTQNIFHVPGSGSGALSLDVELNINAHFLSGPADPTIGTHVGDRDYNDARYLELSGGTMTGDLVAGGVNKLVFGSYPSVSNETFWIVHNNSSSGSLEIWGNVDSGPV